MSRWLVRLLAPPMAVDCTAWEWEQAIRASERRLVLLEIERAARLTGYQQGLRPALSSEPAGNLYRFSRAFRG